jgi:hypothetical protein
MDRLMRKEFAELLEISEPMKIVDNLSIGMISKKKKNPIHPLDNTCKFMEFALRKTNICIFNALKCHG